MLESGSAMLWYTSEHQSTPNKEKGAWYVAWTRTDTAKVSLLYCDVGVKSPPHLYQGRQAFSVPARWRQA